MRITEAIQLNTVLASESRVAQRLNTLTSQASSGIAVSAPSDDPAAFASIVRQNAQIAAVQSRSSAVKLAAGDLNLAETTLDQASTLMSSAHQIAIEAANGTMNSDSRASSAKQIDALRTQLLALANTQGSNGYLFGGTNNGSPPFSASGVFTGNEQTTQVEVASAVYAPSNADGAAAFTSAAGGRDVFADLKALSDALNSNDTAGIQSSITAVNASQQQLISSRIDAGERAARLSSASDAMSSALTQMQIQLAGVQDADPVSTLSNLQATQTAYQQAVQVNTQILQAAHQSGG